MGRRIITNKTKIVIPLFFLTLTLLFCLGTASAALEGSDNITVPSDNLTISNVQNTSSSLNSNGDNSPDSSGSTSNEILPDPQIYRDGVAVDRGHGAGYVYLTITAAIADALPGDTIMLENGVYHEHFIVTKNLTFNIFSGTVTFTQGGTGPIITINSGVTAILQNLNIIGLDTQGILNQGTLTVQNCNFARNRGVFGGAIDNNNILTVQNCDFLENWADSCGGAISNIGTCTITDSTFNNNKAALGGGALNNQGSTMNFSGCTFIGNNATDLSYGNGGVIFNYMATVNAHFNRFYNNTAKYGLVIANIENPSGTSGPVNAENNWWGSNINPTTIPNLIGGNNVDSNPWIMLTITSSDDLIDSAGTTNIIANLKYNSNNQDTLALYGDSVPNVNVAFNADSLGSVSPTSGTISNGLFTTVFTAGSNFGNSIVNATCNSQKVNTTIRIRNMTDVYVATTGNDATGDGSSSLPFQSLLKAISEVRASGTVHVANGVYTGSSNRDITIAKTINIFGQSQSGTVINGQHLGRIFTITSGMLNLVNLTLVNGTALNGTRGTDGEDGGILYNPEDGTAGNSGSAGGAIHNSGIVIAENCTFSNNTAGNGGNGGNGGSGIGNGANGANSGAGGNGGAIYNTGWLILTNCTFTGNKAGNGGTGGTGGTGLFGNGGSGGNGNNGGSGGAIYNSGTGIILITSCIINNNSAGNGGIGGIGGVGVVGNGTAGGNGGTGGNGGAIYNLMTLNINTSNINNNTAGNGGLGGTGGNGSTNVVIETTTFNTYGGNGGNGGAGGNSGAIYNTMNFTIKSSNITQNTIGNGANGGTGGIGGLGNGNTGTGGTSGNGGAIYTGSANNVVINFNRIIGNTAPQGSAIFCASGSVDATSNWWGSNANPNSQVTGLTILNWLVLNLTANPTLIGNGGTSNITADLLHDQNGVYYDPASDHVPEGIPVTFATTLGTITSPLSTVNGTAKNTLNGGSVSGVADVSTTVDSQTIHTSVTIDATKPTVTSTNPAQYAVNLPSNQVFTVTFSEAILAANLNLVVLKTSTGTVIPTAKSITGNVLTITPNITLNEAKYLLLLYAGCVTDLAGNPTAAMTRTYSVGASPYVTSTDPANYALNVARNKVITATFNEPILAKYLTLIYLKTTTGVIIPTSKSVSGNVLTITPPSPLAAGTRYLVLIYYFALTDLSGNPNVNKQFTFTTGAT